MSSCEMNVAQLDALATATMRHSKFQRLVKDFMILTVVSQATLTFQCAATAGELKADF